ncbi:hypothetical protein FA13DRAFT_1784998 [Coprinellus micaceus]|uniref:DRBM domain-containing protein n=1 Tax=Coprinellus micaceus TaxID=71717 RepID=A0A4Y7TWZ5_COPMI|nr:hypothetical protein FA13DRAFT_1784998 [Coprinellus micaceus]
MSDKGTSLLNQHLQKIGRVSSLSWEESASGPAHARQWECICKIDGETRGRGVASHKHVAKDQAAEEALAFLTKEPEAESST